jgi:hypothetical protein
MKFPLNRKRSVVKVAVAKSDGVKFLKLIPEFSNQNNPKLEFLLYQHDDQDKKKFEKELKRAQKLNPQVTVKTSKKSIIDEVGKITFDFVISNLSLSWDGNWMCAFKAFVDVLKTDGSLILEETTNRSENFS